MNYYLLLQYTIINRKFKDFGIHPLAGKAITIAAFIILSYFLFSKTEFAVYIYFVAAFSVLLNFTDQTRNDFLRLCFHGKDYYKVRIAENFCVTFPFIIFMILNSQFFFALLLLCLALLTAVSNINVEVQYTIPTPFSRKPFEFIKGFRNTFFLFGLYYFITVMSILAYNFNLGIFSLLMVFVTILPFYLQPENQFYVWIYNLNAKQFLKEKITTCIIHSTVLCFPVIVALAVFFTESFLFVAGFLLLGYLSVITIILAKYAYYPKEISPTQGILIALALYFPPMLLFVLPFFYLQSIKRLNEILE
jgi:hypothetical protein